MTFRRAVVLGATGFIGSAVTRALEDSAVDVTTPNSADLNLFNVEAYRRLSEFLDPGTLLVVAVRATAPTALHAFEREVGIATNIARATPSAGKVVVLSTLSVYTDARTLLNISEATPSDPTSIYGISKLASELVIRQTAEDAHVPSVLLRPCRVFGPGDHKATYGPSSFVRSALTGKPIQIYGDGEELRDHVYVDDIAELVVRMGISEAEGTFVVGTGESTTYLEIVEMIERCIGRRVEIQHLPRDRPRVDQTIDIAKLRSALPAFAFTSLNAAVPRTVAAFRAEFERELHG